MRTVYLGIDPGMSGAIGVIDARGGFESVHDLPIIRDGKLAWVDGGKLLSLIMEIRSGRHAIAMIERVHSMPRQGVASSFTFGVGFGSLLAGLQASNVPLHFVQPEQWKIAAGLKRDRKDKRTKGASLAAARLLFPTAQLDLKKHEGRAEALLIARHLWKSEPRPHITNYEPKAPSTTLVTGEYTTPRVTGEYAA